MLVSSTPFAEPDAFLAKQRAIDEARRRMQEQYNIAAAISLEKKKEVGLVQHMQVSLP